MCFLKTFLLRSLIVKSQHNRIELVTSPEDFQGHQDEGDGGPQGQTQGPECQTASSGSGEGKDGGQKQDQAGSGENEV